jgi:hypothetical protein
MMNVTVGEQGNDGGNRKSLDRMTRTLHLPLEPGEALLSEIGLRTPGVSPGVKARSRRLQVFIRRF